MSKYIIRNLHDTDYSTNYLQLLGQDFAINSNTITYTDFAEYVSKLHNSHQVFVIENDNNDADIKSTNSQIIGSSTIFIETKIIHNFGRVAHIEDVIVHNEYRGHGLGKLLLDKCIEIAKQEGCYKIILDCSDNNCKFYEKCGFMKKGNQMALYF